MKESNRAIFSGMQILTDHKWMSDQAVVIEETTIKAIIPKEMIKHHLPATLHEFPADYYLIPGLIDLHIHGANHKDVMDGTKDAILTISHALASEGVTGFLATTMTASDEQIEKALKAVASTRDDQEGAAILGVHLEGPFLAKTKAGAQQKSELKSPDIKLIRHWQSISDNAIKLVTLAPELRDAIACIEALRDMNIIVSAGHTNATYEETNAAIKAGCSQATHLFNAMRGMHQREPGALCALLLSHAVSAELIVDGIHIHPAMVDLAWQIKGKDRLLLVSDAMRAKCLRNGEYEFGGEKVHVEEAKVTLPDGTLAGSTLRLPRAIKNMMQFSQCQLHEAIYMASLNPARVLGIDKQKGSIAIGKDADITLLNADFEAVLTVREGRIIFSRV